MSFYKVNRGDIEQFSVITNPIRHYTSSSMGATGSVYVFPRRTDLEKEIAPDPSFVEATHDDSDLASALFNLQAAGKMARLVAASPLSGTLSAMLESYLDKVAEQGRSAHKQKFLDIIRFTPTVDFTSNTLRKLIVKEVLNPYYHTSYPSAHWAYTNYNTLNFFTASTVPESSVLLYPNVDTGPSHQGYVSGTYSLSGAFSFDFYVNPRHTNETPDGEFKAGTLLHLSSTYAVSLVSGSLKDHNGRVAGFRVQLQLSHSADIPPSSATPGTYPRDLVFLSDDNSLLHDHWHHVVVRWGTNLVNRGTGSFNIDGTDRGTFVVPSGTISPQLFSNATRANPDVLCVGNYYEGLNTGTSAQAYFLANDPALRDGLFQLIDDVVGIDEPFHYSFRHPFKGEVHDLAIKRYYMTNVDVAASASAGPKSIDTGWTAFYLPPFFIEESPFRQFVGMNGGIMQTPFFEVDGTTNDPFNVAMSFGVDGHYINIENFLRDFASNVFPLVHHMTGVALDHSTEAREANEFLYDQPMVVRRNLLIMPCDDGNFVPSFELVASESMKASQVDDLDIEERSFIHLDGLLSTSSFLFGGAAFDDGTAGSDKINSYANEAIGFTPEQPGLPPGRAFFSYVDKLAKAIQSGAFDPGIQVGAPLTIFQRTRDPSSNQVTFFDISNLYYGKRILPGSLELADPALSGSAGAFGITLKDDGRGNVYRADCVTSASTWNSVGNCFYDEGLIVIKSPHLYFFGKEGFEISFRGEQSVHVMMIDALAPANQLNSSSNPNYKPVPPSLFPNDPDKKFVYVTGLNFHDQDLNVVMKTQLAQPFMKREGDRVCFRIKYDF